MILFSNKIKVGHLIVSKTNGAVWKQGEIVGPQYMGHDFIRYDNPNFCW